MIPTAESVMFMDTVCCRSYGCTLFTCKAHLW